MTFDPTSVRSIDRPGPLNAGPLDVALAAFHRHGPEYGGGMSSHGPMVVESLEHAGLVDDVEPWAADYLGRLEPAVPDEFQGRIEPVLGDGRTAAWTATFDAELGSGSWRDVVGEWAPRLVSGSAGAAGHGVLRTAHAVRSLGRSESPARVAELAHGLGYWAATSFSLPGRPATGTATLQAALESTPATRSDAWFISERLSAIDAATFGPAVAAAALPSDPDDAITAVIDLALRVLATNPGGAIAFIHAVTVPACTRHLLPFVGGADRLAVANQAWWVLAAMWSAYGEHPALDSDPTGAPAWDELVAAALRSGDEHDIKLVVAARDQVGRVDELLLRSVVGGVVLGS